MVIRLFLNSFVAEISLEPIFKERYRNFFPLLYKLRIIIYKFEKVNKYSNSFVVNKNNSNI